MNTKDTTSTTVGFSGLNFYETYTTEVGRHGCSSSNIVGNCRQWNRLRIYQDFRTCKKPPMSWLHQNFLLFFVLSLLVFVIACVFFSFWLEFQIIRFVMSTFTQIFFIEISFVIPPPPPYKLTLSTGGITSSRIRTFKNKRFNPGLLLAHSSPTDSLGHHKNNCVYRINVYCGWSGWMGPHLWCGRGWYNQSNNFMSYTMKGILSYFIMVVRDIIISCVTMKGCGGLALGDGLEVTVTSATTASAEFTFPASKTPDDVCGPQAFLFTTPVPFVLAVQSSGSPDRMDRSAPHHPKHWNRCRSKARPCIVLGISTFLVCILSL